MLKRYMPHTNASAQTPLLRYAFRGIRWGSTPEALTRYTLKGIGLVVGVVIALWLLMMVLENALMTSCSGQMPCSYYGAQAGSSLIPIVFIISVLMDALLDFACVVAAMNSMKADASTAQLDLLRLTPQRDYDIIQARHIEAQVRAWRMFTVVFGARTAFLVLGGLQLAITLLFNRSGVSYLTLIEAWVMVGFIVFFTVYLLEPLWRLRAVTALGVWFAARFHTTFSISIAAVAALPILWVIQAFLLWVMIMLSGFLLFTVILIPAAPAAVGGFIYLFYRILQRSSLSRALKNRMMWEGQAVV